MNDMNKIRRESGRATLQVKKAMREKRIRFDENNEVTDKEFNIILTQLRRTTPRF